MTWALPILSCSSCWDLSIEGAVGAVDREAEVAVEAHSGLVVGLGVEHPDEQAGTVEVVEAGEDEATAQAPLVGGRIAGDDVDLTERRLGAGVHLRPADTHEVVVYPVQEEAGGVEPQN